MKSGLTEPWSSVLTPDEAAAVERPRAILLRPEPDNHRFSANALGQICAATGIEHWPTRPDNPRTIGQVKRVNRTIKDATVKRFQFETQDQLRTHLAVFPAACNFARRLKTPNGLTLAEGWTGGLSTQSNSRWCFGENRPDAVPNARSQPETYFRDLFQF